MKRKCTTAALFLVVALCIPAALGFQGTKTLDQLPAITTLAPGDELMVWQVGSGTTKKITWVNASATSGWPGSNQSSFFPATSADTTNSYLANMTVTTDAGLVVPGFTDVGVFDTTNNYFGGDDFADQSAKSTLFLKANTLSAQGAGQKFMNSDKALFYGMGDAFPDFLSYYYLGGVECGGDEGQGGRRIVHQQSDSGVVRTTIASVPAPSTINTTLSGATGAITAVTNATPIQITSAAHGLVTGNIVLITGVGGTTSANRTWKVTVIDGNNFTLNGSGGNGAYSGGGTWGIRVITRGQAIQTATVASTTGLAVGQWCTCNPQFPVFNNTGATGFGGTALEECVKASNVTATSFDSVFRHDHFAGEAVMPATVIKPSGGGGRFGQNRWIVNLTQPSYSTGTASASGVTVTGIGTTWTQGMVGGSANNVGLVSFAADDTTNTPFGAGNSRLRDWYPINPNGLTNTSFGLWHLQVPSIASYSGLATSPGAYEIRPAARLARFDMGTTTGWGVANGSSGTNNTGTIVLPYNTFTWTAGDTIECTHSPDITYVGDTIYFGFSSAGGTYNQNLQYIPTGSRKVQSGIWWQPASYLGSDAPWGQCLHIGTGTILTADNGILFSGKYTNSAITLSNTATTQNILWMSNSASTGAGIRYDGTGGKTRLSMQFSADGTADVTDAVVKSKILYTNDSINNAVGSFGVGGYITPDNGIINKQTTLTAVTTIANSDKFQTYLVNGATFAVTLPAANAVPAGKEYTFKKIDAGAANNVTAAGADTIDGAATYSLSAQFKYVRVTSDGTSKWYVIASNLLLLLPLGRRRLRNLYQDWEPQFQQAA